MTLASLLSEPQIVLDLTASTRWGAIEELAARLFDLQLLPANERESVMALLRERELRLSTGIGSGVAIPHALCPHVDRVVAVMGRSIAGIDFAAIDKAPVHLIVLFVLPEREYRLRLETLSAIGKSLTRAELRQRLLRAESTAEVLAVLSGRPGSRTQIIR